jgi:hypothetical protein
VVGVDAIEAAVQDLVLLVRRERRELAEVRLLMLQPRPSVSR